jgi:hypothetical protein
MMNHVVRLQPTRILDIGPGFGKWGFLIREALDFMLGRLDRDEWNVTIDGVDAFPYNSPILPWVYDSIQIVPALDALLDLSGYDLVVLGDVIEHFTKEDGMRLLRALVARNKNVLVATPMDFFEQEVGGNPYEQHLSLWTQGDFDEWIYDYDVVAGSVLVVLLAGLDATLPTGANAFASRRVYSLPGMTRRGATAAMLKRLIVSQRASSVVNLLGPPRPKT